MNKSAPDLIVFDEICIFCSRFAQLVARHDHADRFRFVAAQSDRGQALYREHNLDPDAMDTNIVIVDGKAHTELDAFITVMRHLGGPFRLLTILKIIPEPLAGWLYRQIATNRYIFGKRACALPSEEFRGKLIEEDIRK